MTHHLSTLQIKKLCVSALPEEELAAAAAHTAECESCHQQFVAELKQQGGDSSGNFTLEPGFWFRNDHVNFEQLVALADKTIDQETQEIINIHLSSCETCDEDVRSFLASRNASVAQIDALSERAKYEPTRNLPSGLWQRLQSPPVYVMAAIVLVALALLIGVIALTRRSHSLEAGNRDHPSGIEPSPNISASPGPFEGAGSPSINDSAKVAILKDTGGEVTIDKNGVITGLDQVSLTSRRYVARAALSEQIETSEVLRRLSGEQSGLRGNDNREHEFKLLYPVRRVVTESRPVFRWQSLPGASSYRVYVMDADGNQVDESEELPPTNTQWKGRALRRGQVFSWVVAAIVEGKKVVSPSASLPEIRFAVLSRVDSQELAQLKRVNSHLALGVFYARIGLLDEAEREFQALINLNPRGELPRKLLQSVRSRQEN